MLRIILLILFLSSISLATINDNGQRQWFLLDTTDSVTDFRAWTLLNSTDSVSSFEGGTWNITNIAGTISLPTGAATSALQTTGNASLSSIDAGVPAGLGRTTATNSMPVVLPSDQYSANSGTPTQTSISCGTSSTTLLAASTATVFVSIRNPTTSTQTVWINITGAAAVAAAPSIDLAPGSEADYFMGENSFLPTALLTCIASTASTVTLVYK